MRTSDGAAPSCAFAVPAGLDVEASSAAFWSLLMLPNASSSHQHWHSTAAAPLIRTKRYFCCATAQRAWYSCACLRPPKGAKESWPTCLDHPLEPAAVPTLPAAAGPSGAPLDAPCLVYSFGIADQWEFDDGMADRGCEVHSFDPTGSSMASHQKHAHKSGRVHFHPWGLSSEAPKGCGERRGDARRFVGGTYGNLTGPLLSLERIVRRLGHVGRRISVLKIDCEGCEWDAMHHVATRSAGLMEHVDEIYMELHLALQMATADDLVKWATMYDLLFQRSGFKLWWAHPNAARAPGDRLNQPFLRSLSAKVSYGRSWDRGPPALAWEIGLRRFEATAVSGGSAAAQCPKGRGHNRG